MFQQRGRRVGRQRLDNGRKYCRPFSTTATFNICATHNSYRTQNENCTRYHSSIQYHSRAFRTQLRASRVAFFTPSSTKLPASAEHEHRNRMRMRFATCSIRSVIQFLLRKPVRLVVKTDSSGAKTVGSRSGIGRMGNALVAGKIEKLHGQDPHG